MLSNISGNFYTQNKIRDVHRFDKSYSALKPASQPSLASTNDVSFCGFSKLLNSIKGDKSVYEATIKAAIDKVKGLPYELGILVNNRGKVIAEIVGNDHQVVIPKKIENFIKRHKYTITLVHGHPSYSPDGRSYPVSMPDLFHANRIKLKKTISVDGIGTITSLSPKGKKWPKDPVLFELFDNYRESIADIAFDSSIPPEIMAQRKHDFWFKNADKYGITYEQNTSYLGKAKEEA